MMSLHLRMQNLKGTHDLKALRRWWDKLWLVSTAHKIMVSCQRGETGRSRSGIWRNKYSNIH